MHVRHPSANVSRALIAFLVLSCNSPTIRGQAAPPAPLFVVHGTARNCSSITQLDSALSSNYQAYFTSWTEQDYRDAIAWSQACADFGWHVPGRPRIPLLQAQHDKALGPTPARVDTSSADSSLQRAREPTDLSGEPPVRAPLELPADGSPVIGSDTTILSHQPRHALRHSPPLRSRLRGNRARQPQRRHLDSRRGNARSSTHTPHPAARLTRGHCREPARAPALLFSETRQERSYRWSSLTL